MLAVRGPRGHRRHRAVGLEADHPGEVRAEAGAPTSATTGAKSSLRGHAAGDERRHAPQRGLLTGELTDGLA